MQEFTIGRSLYEFRKRSFDDSKVFKKPISLSPFVGARIFSGNVKYIKTERGKEFVTALDRKEKSLFDLFLEHFEAYKIPASMVDFLPTNTRIFQISSEDVFKEKERFERTLKKHS